MGSASAAPTIDDIHIVTSATTDTLDRLFTIFLPGGYDPPSLSGPQQPTMHEFREAPTTTLVAGSNVRVRCGPISTSGRWLGSDSLLGTPDTHLVHDRHQRIVP